jgi:hypothetical protein
MLYWLYLVAGTSRRLGAILLLGRPGQSWTAKARELTS